MVRGPEVSFFASLRNEYSFLSEDNRVTAN